MTDERTRFGVVVFEKSNNIGDDIQSYAAACLLPRVDYRIEREQIDLFRPSGGEKVSAIVNGWFSHNKLAWPVSPYIDPLFLSIHFVRNDALGIGDRFLDGPGSEDLIRCGPVGCRDLETLELLREKGIDAWFSACLTLTLNREFPETEGGYICLVDVKPGVEAFVRKSCPDRGIRVITHRMDPAAGLTWEERSGRVKELLTVYQNASAVVTSRIHCALPCLALGTPVLFLQDSRYDVGRQKGLTELFHSSTAADYLSGRFDYDLNDPPENPETFREYAARIRETVSTFLQTRTEAAGRVDLPDPDAEFRRRAEWKNDILLQVSMERKVPIRAAERRGDASGKKASAKAPGKQLAAAGGGASAKEKEAPADGPARIVIRDVRIGAHQISCEICAEGSAASAFKKPCSRYLYRSELDLTAVPPSIAVLPALADVLPVSWVLDVPVEIDECDENFLQSIPEFRQGFVRMYPKIPFGGSVRAKKAVRNAARGDRAIAFFSGGVDSFDTLIRHIDEAPVALTVRGSDVPLSDVDGWNALQRQAVENLAPIGVQSVFVETNFRLILDNRRLNETVKEAGDNWWHGFQHGLGLISLAAPVSYVTGASKVYFASSFTPAEIGTYTCGSDPTIDNYIRFGGVRVFHDGYETDRQEKVRNIAAFCRKTGKTLRLHVCFVTHDGNNCCHCEKCWRTILALYAEGEDPRGYGFEYGEFSALCEEIHAHADLLTRDFNIGYFPTIRALREHYTEETVCPELKWLYRIPIMEQSEFFSWLRTRDVRYSSERSALAAEKRDLAAKNRKLSEALKEQKRKNAAVRRSKSYRLGRALTAPFRKLRSWKTAVRAAKLYWSCYGAPGGWRRAYADFMKRRIGRDEAWEIQKKRFLQILRNDHPDLAKGPAGRRLRLLDYARCNLFLGAWADSDYFYTQLYRYPWRIRNHLVTNGRAVFAGGYLNDPDARALCLDKGRSAEYWSAWYHRASLVKRAEDYITADELREVFRGCRRVIVKPLRDYGGKGIFVLPLRNEDEIREAANRLNAVASDCIAEAYVEQTGVLHELNPSSLNTVRLITFRHADGRIENLFSILRTGRRGAVVDNTSSGGISFEVDLTNGRVLAGDDYRGNRYTAHPDSGAAVTGTEIPRWSEFVGFCAEAHRHAPEGLRLAAWDVSVSDDGLTLLEVNEGPAMAGRRLRDANLWKSLKRLFAEKQKETKRS